MSRPWINAARWRTGLKLGRTLYAMVGAEPSLNDECFGVVDTPDIAARIVEDHNRWLTAATFDERALTRADADARECCLNPEWRGHACDFHQGFEVGAAAALEALRGGAA